MTTLTKCRVAELQLLKAIELYCSGELVPSITLAGAAEEILGGLLARGGGTTALQEEVEDRLDLLRTVLGKHGDRRLFVDELNGMKNDLKHYSQGHDMSFDLEQGATDIIDRAIRNFQKLKPGLQEAFIRFDDVATARIRRNVSDAHPER